MFDFDSVSHLNGYIKQSLQDNPYLAEFTVTGEISQYTVSARDHAYFSIKDDQSVINCVIFSRNRSMLKIEPSVGMKVKVTGVKDGKISLSMRALEETPKEAPAPEEERIVLPKTEKLTTNLGSLLKGIKLD